jgi:CRISPR-associated DxTHG motif protein
MLVCVSEAAEQQNWSLLEALGDSRIQSIEIPIGRNTAEMWQTFKIITAHIAEGDRVIFDITHGLRSLPFLVFLFAAYLKEAKNVIIEAIYDGALELGNSRSEPPIPFSAQRLDYELRVAVFASVTACVTASLRLSMSGIWTFSRRDRARSRSRPTNRTTN